jgi:hypothetical protein
MPRVHLVAVAVFTLALAGTANAQTGRVSGIVKDPAGKPIKGATVRASNPDLVPREFTSTTDDKGRFAMIGLRTAASWHFVVEAPGFFPGEGDALIRSQPGPPFEFVMRRDPGPLPGALSKDIQAQLAAANALRDEGRFDQAIAAYQSIQTKNPKLTTLNLVIAGTYRERAERETDPAARVVLFEKAVTAYADVLKDDAANERAKTEMAAVTTRLQELKKN